MDHAKNLVNPSQPYGIRQALGKFLRWTSLIVRSCRAQEMDLRQA